MQGILYDISWTDSVKNYEISIKEHKKYKKS